MTKEKNKSVQTSCKMDKKVLENFIREISALEGIEKIEPTNIHEEERFQLHNHLL